MCEGKVGTFKPLDSESKKVPFSWQERYVFLFLGIKQCACGHLKLSEKQDEVDPLRLQYKNTILSLYILFVFLTENTICNTDTTTHDQY